MYLTSHPLHAGGLPYGWLSTNRVFTQLKFLDLSVNQLGRDMGGKLYATTEGWCQAGPGTLGADDSRVGWCPRGVPLDFSMRSLETLDLSDNGLRGECFWRARLGLQGWAVGTCLLMVARTCSYGHCTTYLKSLQQCA
jgi:hypothetical protein